MATIRVGREALLKILESVAPGLAAREILEQSSCFVFLDGCVYTFNDEVACSRKMPIKLEGAVKAKPLVDLLSKMTEDDIEIEQTGEELIVKGKRRKAGIRMEAEVRLPIESLETPEEWASIDASFSEAVNIVHSCASREESQFVLTCVHIHPEYLEACDRFQVARYPMDTGVAQSVLVRAESLKKVVGYDMTEMAETDSWMHFRNPAGLTLSCRRYLEEYRDLSQFLSAEGTTPVNLPGGLEEVIAKAEIFSSDNATGNHIKVELRPDRVMISGEGASGWFKEMKKITFQGDPVQFLIAPRLLLEVASRSERCGVSDRRLFIDSGKFLYASATVVEHKADAGATTDED